MELAIQWIEYLLISSSAHTFDGHSVDMAVYFYNNRLFSSSGLFIKLFVCTVCTYGHLFLLYIQPRVPHWNSITSHIHTTWWNGIIMLQLRSMFFYWNTTYQTQSGKCGIHSRKSTFNRIGTFQANRLSCGHFDIFVNEWETMSVYVCVCE